MAIQKAIFSQFFYLQTSIGHLKRPQKSCFTSRYFKEVLFAWEENIDIQPVLNHYKAVAYMGV